MHIELDIFLLAEICTFFWNSQSLSSLRGSWLMLPQTLTVFSSKGVSTE